MPDPARAALLDWLRQTRPGLETRLRAALYTLLEQHGPPADSAAWNDYGLHLAFNQWLTASDPKTKKALEAQIARWMEEHGAPDFITVRELRGQPGPLDQLLPDSWKKRLFKGRLPALGLRDIWKDGLRAALALFALAFGLYLGWQPAASECAGELADLRLAGETLRVCADSEAERALLREYQLRQAAAEADTARFDRLLRAPGPPLSPEGRANAANAAYNAGIPDYRRADSLRQTQPGYQSDSSALYRGACAWFARARAADTSLAWVRDAVAWYVKPVKYTATPNTYQNCYRVANIQNGLGFRTRPLTRAEYAQLDNNSNTELEKSTLIRIIPSGGTVIVLDSTLLAWKIQHNGRIGFVAKKYKGKTTLLPCLQTQSENNSFIRRSTEEISVRKHALLFAINDYSSTGWPTLQSPILQATQLSEVLQNEFGFEVTFLRNPNKSEIMRQLEYYKKHTYAGADQLFIYFSGHGEKGYLIPSDGEREAASSVNIIIEDLLRLVNAIPCTQILLIVDATATNVKKERSRDIEKLQMNYPSRLFVAAGLNVRVPERSELTLHLVQTLKQLPLNEVMTFDRLWSSLQKSTPKPYYSEFGNDSNGDFNFVKISISANQTALPLPESIRKLESDMVSIDGGSFTMGCQDAERDGECTDDEKPAHRVTVRDFAIGRYEVTQAQWRAVMGGDPPQLYNTGCDECPVESVSWDDIQEFLKKLNARTGKTYRLPTEAEWEYAARGGAGSKGYLYSGSNNLDEVGWYDGNYKKGNIFGTQKTTRPVGRKKANELGLYDMSGNVREWCQDWYGKYPVAAQNDPKEPKKGSRRVRRGGSWLLSAQGCRVSSRDSDTPSSRLVGFRLASAPQ
jgi:formylglycine-generating enzyme required for sulfatase activity